MCQSILWDMATQNAKFEGNAMNIVGMAKKSKTPPSLTRTKITHNW